LVPDGRVGLHREVLVEAVMTLSWTAAAHATGMVLYALRVVHPIDIRRSVAGLKRSGCYCTHVPTHGITPSAPGLRGGRRGEMVPRARSVRFHRWRAPPCVAPRRQSHPRCAGWETR